MEILVGGTWRGLPALGTPRAAYPALGVVGVGRLIIAGGSSGEGALDSVEEFDMEQQIWKETKIKLKRKRAKASYGFVRKSVCESISGFDERLDNRGRKAASSVTFLEQLREEKEKKKRVKKVRRKNSKSVIFE